MLDRVMRDWLRPLWATWIKWPMPLWRIRGHGTFDISGEQLIFHDVAEPPTAWWSWLARDGRYERPVIDFLSGAIRPGDVFFDVGAFNGMYSMLAARKGATVIAFEPDPTFSRLYLRNLASNGLRAELVAVAIGAGDGTMNLTDDHAGSLMSHPSPDGTGVTVDVVSLDGFCRERVWPDVIKMDIEGAEYEALGDAAAETLAHVRVLVVEIHGDRGGLVDRLSRRFDVHELERRHGNLNVACVSRERSAS